ncbi:Kef-type K+ transport system, predicted NAD-binding component [Hahella chejuensis KCTC 2396]|uniref:Kef-type K+ transport system, predicted NAD-binding component n=1 Tax=Hahella chejuensis (strain KCTC 2396) TaxID=349521 RepID=Q2SA22_HAHCH|nr:potassium channel family protein [Hahella chejuensis]ABC32502.1 Kef-type K+ transport system, predicted NAD-binding component [Hahella chejuensis KCTC 2396]
MSLSDRLPIVTGLAGVSVTENSRARFWGQILEWPMMMLAIWIIIEWYLQANDELSGEALLITDWLIWLFFIVETLLLTALVDKKTYYLRNNWVNLIIILFGCPLIWWFSPLAGALRTLRLLVMFSLLLQISGTARRLLSRHNLGNTLFIGFIVIIMAGFIIAGLDPAIETPWDGVWWAWVTVTTVGYGDIVPTSTVGRLFASFLILLGMALFSLLTAGFSAFFVSQDEKDQVRRDLEILNKLNDLEMKMERLERHLTVLAEEVNVKNNGRPDATEDLDTRETPDV